MRELKIGDVMTIHGVEHVAVGHNKIQEWPVYIVPRAGTMQYDEYAYIYYTDLTHALSIDINGDENANTLANGKANFHKINWDVWRVVTKEEALARVKKFPRFFTRFSTSANDPLNMAYWRMTSPTQGLYVSLNGSVEQTGITLEEIIKRGYCEITANDAASIDDYHKQMKKPKPVSPAFGILVPLTTLTNAGYQFGTKFWWDPRTVKHEDDNAHLAASYRYISEHPDWQPEPTLEEMTMLGWALWHNHYNPLWHWNRVGYHPNKAGSDFRNALAIVRKDFLNVYKFDHTTGQWIKK